MATMPVKFIDLGRIEYQKALDIQLAAVDKTILNQTVEERVYLVEHDPVFTIGRNGGIENLIRDTEFLKQRNIKVVKTGRGGNITYHGPGQAVMYPIIDIGKRHISVPDFVFGLEQVMKKTSNDLGVQVTPGKPCHGVWNHHKKLGSVGLGIRKGVTFHGIALNIDLDLTPFSWINPCGLTGITISSIQKETSADLKNNVSVKKAHQLFKYHLCDYFHFTEYFENR